jgi:hypothetical protein
MFVDDLPAAGGFLQHETHGAARLDRALLRGDC